MSYEARTLPATEMAQTLYTYETVKSLEPVQEAISAILGSGIEQIALVAIHVSYDEDARVAATQRATTYLLSNLRLLVRRTDCVFLLEHTMYFVLRGSNQQGGEIVQARLWEALLWRVHNMSDPDMQRPRSMAIGHSGYQEMHASVDACLDAASVVSQRFDWLPEKSRKALRQAHQQSRDAADATDDDDLSEIARRLGIPYLSRLPLKLSAGLQQIISPHLARELGCYPVGRERGALTVAMLNPQDGITLQRLQLETGLDIFPVLVNTQVLQGALEQLG